MRRKTLVLGVLAGSLAASPGSAAEPNGSYREPAYVQALRDGQAERLASPDSLQWNTEIAAWKRENGTLPDGVIDRILRLQSAGAAPGQTQGPAAAQAWAERTSQPLESTYIRRPIFRFYYVIGFAHRLNATCKFLPQSKDLDVAAALDAAVRTFRIGQRSKAEIDALSADEKLALKTMHLTLFAGQSDANTFAKANPCGAPGMTSLTATLSKLLSPLKAVASDTNKQREDRERKAMLIETDDFILGETFVRNGAPQGLFATASRSDVHQATFRVPSAYEQVAGRTVGWFTDTAVLDAAGADNRPVLFVLTEASRDCGQCRTFIQDLLISQSFNRLAGRFHAVLLVANSDPKSLFAQMRTSLDGGTVPGAYLVKLGNTEIPAKLLYRRRPATSANEVAKEIEPLLSGPFEKPAVASDHKPLVAPPSFCWAIETFELCRARQIRKIHVE